MLSFNHVLVPPTLKIETAMPSRKIRGRKRTDRGLDEIMMVGGGGPGVWYFEIHTNGRGAELTYHILSGFVLLTLYLS
jgi:hypothetical protein